MALKGQKNKARVSKELGEKQASSVWLEGRLKDKSRRKWGRAGCGKGCAGLCKEEKSLGCRKLGRLLERFSGLRQEDDIFVLEGRMKGTKMAARLL